MSHNNEVLDGLSFGNGEEGFSPQVGPPAAAPPPPPPSYGYQGGRAARQPSIENYGTPPAEPSRGNSISRGFVLFNPNTGHSNSTDGFALREIVLFMRMLNLSLCTLTILMEVFSWVGDVMTLRLTRLVLGLYLTFFSGLLCCFELHTPYISPFLRQYFGLLYHPYGRAFCLFLMGGMALGQASWIERLLGVLMFLNAAYTTYLPCVYPQYQQVHQLEAENDLMGRAQEGVSQYAWANPHKVARVLGAGSETSAAGTDGNGTETATEGERQRLI